MPVPVTPVTKVTKVTKVTMQSKPKKASSKKEHGAPECFDSDVLSNKYQQKTDKQHILDNPDTYIGSVEEVDTTVWLMKTDAHDIGTDIPTPPKIIEKNIQYVPGLFKLFDEGIVNCRDHVIRMKQSQRDNIPNTLLVKNIEITVSPDGTITMMNDGNGIDVAEHPEHKIWIPEMIFGHLRTSTNYDKTEKKIVGGKNGFGFKLVLIWSTFGSVETVDHVRGLKYYQEFSDNLNVIGSPKITKCKLKPYTKITFKPDYARLGIDGLSPDMISLLRKRVFDVSAITDKTLKVKFNADVIPVKNFQHYIDLYIGGKSGTDRVYDSCGDRWEFAVALAPTHEFTQVSFVNGIHTTKGGKHVEYIVNQIIRKTCEYIEKKKKIKVAATSIKEQLMVFIRCDIENPAFDSQTKDFMNTPMSKFGSKCEVSDKVIEKIAKMGVMYAACAVTELRENKAAKKTDGVKSKNVRGIHKLTDANWAGTARSSECMIIMCEGDSAKAGIISGLSTEDRNTIGVYPMKGKILNVRGENTKKICDNKEIIEIKKILGLEVNKQYSSMSDVSRHLRYGRVLFMTDQDLDGSHIKGLGINLFHSEWSSLIEIPGFIGFMNTPILKARKNAQELLFYNEGEYCEWKNTLDTSSWKIKYYKGLGTSTGKEFREYFKHKKIVDFVHTGGASNDVIDMAFNKKRSNDRKDWLETYERTSFLNTGVSNVTYEEFIHKEFIHFSKYDCDRSIPNLMDGLKISLRKILFAAFKKNLSTEIKVAQFSGYVSEHSGYHHGEASLNGAIVGMSQNFVGSNNINLLLPNGQFGTRLQGGKDSASERYIFTALNSITRTLFPKSDDNILKYLDDDGTPVEPAFYAPIIPMILVNGSKGIGTGFSTDIMCYNPMEIIQYLKFKLAGSESGEALPTDDSWCAQFDFIPYYEGFHGTIDKISNEKFMIKGRYTKTGVDKITVTELPVGFWTESFKELLEGLIDPAASGGGNSGDKATAATVQYIKDYDDMSKDTTVEFNIIFAKGKLDSLENIHLDNNCNGVDKLLRLATTRSTTNMHLFDADDKLRKYSSVVEIINDYFGTRLTMYQTRKDFMISAMERELVLLSNKARYIQENLDDTIDLRKKTKPVIVDMLKAKLYDVINGDDDYKYLVKMPMDSVTKENVDKLFNDHKDKVAELDLIKLTTTTSMWLSELAKLETEYGAYRIGRTANDVVSEKKSSKSVKTKPTKTKPTKTKPTKTKPTKTEPKIPKSAAATAAPQQANHLLIIEE